jgi:hypothetical protein
MLIHSQTGISPKVYAFIFAILLNPNVIPSIKAVITKKRAKFASYAILISIMPFIAKFGVGVGPNIEEIIAAGPALLLQELGNVATVLIALPVAVLVFGMGRDCKNGCIAINDTCTYICWFCYLANGSRFVQKIWI